MSDQEVQCPECAEGAPAWVMTFADLMSLLMCFFVLLLSFSEMEATKFKQMAGTMRMAFGVQREIEATDTPMGTSVITQEFSPGKPEPTVLEDIRQTTTEEKPELDVFREAEESEAIEEKAEELREELKEAVDEGILEIETREETIIIRIKEKGSFPSGSDEMREDFIPVLMKITEHLVTTPGKIEVVGHTDNIPIRTFRFRSNWELSSARAVSVLHQLLRNRELDPERLEVKGQADTHPLAANDSAENRAQNRRVEIVIIPGKTGEEGIEGPTSVIEIN
jgi:chemotaxis protein MotB